MARTLEQLARSLPLANERYWHGELTLAARACAAVLNSRQGRYPRGGEPWVQATLRAAADVVHSEQVLLAGTGLITWELSAWAAGEALGEVILLVPLPKGIIPDDAPLRLQTVMDDFGVQKQNSLAIPYFVPPRMSGKALWKARDAWILTRAERLLPVSIRPGGFLSDALADPAVSEKLDRTFAAGYDPYRHSFAPPPDRAAVEEALHGFEWAHAVHWTRAAHGPWPGEPRADFYRDLLAAPDDYPRDASATLRHILETGRLRGSGWRMPMGVPIVSLSLLHPAEMVARMTWRRRYLQMAFEPWGIAVTLAVLRELGAREVEYGDEKDRLRRSARDRLYFQLLSEQADWIEEREVRLRGDLHLDLLGDDDAVVFVPNEDAAREFAHVSRFPVRALSRGSV